MLQCSLDLFDIRSMYLFVSTFHSFEAGIVDAISNFKRET